LHVSLTHARTLICIKRPGRLPADARIQPRHRVGAFAMLGTKGEELSWSHDARSGAERAMPKKEDVRPHTKSEELRAFLGLSVVLAPVLAFIAVAGYGFLVWMFQIVAGPPGSQL
jgi:periplasmic nitrate reductase NapE